tara:strand:+ start:1971 stop:2849 length:879 start_codon:yes stop_codon:yes gene_type:complete
MKLTKQKLYKLILEELSSSEEEFYGSDFSQMTKGGEAFKDHSSDYDPQFKWIENNIGKRIGKGRSRVVFELSNKMIVKIAYGDYEEDGKQSNFIEGKLFNKHPKVFPRVYALDPDGKWMICDRVEVVEYVNYDHSLSDRKFANALAEGFSVIDKFLQFLKSYRPEVQNEDDRMELFFEDDVGGRFSVWKIIRSLYTSTSPKDEESRFDRFKNFLKKFDYPEDIIEQGWDLLNKDSKLMEFFLTTKSLGVNLWDIRAGNVGFTMKDKRFVIIDISVFSNEQAALFKDLKNNRN